MGEVGNAAFGKTEAVAGAQEENKEMLFCEGDFFLTFVFHL